MAVGREGGEGRGGEGRERVILFIDCKGGVVTHPFLLEEEEADMEHPLKSRKLSKPFTPSSCGKDRQNDGWGRQSSQTMGGVDRAVRRDSDI